jgi:hypothetical protein
VQRRIILRDVRLVRNLFIRTVWKSIKIRVNVIPQSRLVRPTDALCAIRTFSLYKRDGRIIFSARAAQRMIGITILQMLPLQIIDFN